MSWGVMKMILPLGSLLLSSLLVLVNGYPYGLGYKEQHKGHLRGICAWHEVEDGGVGKPDISNFLGGCIVEELFLGTGSRLLRRSKLYVQNFWKCEIIISKIPRYSNPKDPRIWSKTGDDSVYTFRRTVCHDGTSVSHRL